MPLDNTISRASFLPTTDLFLRQTRHRPYIVEEVHRFGDLVVPTRAIFSSNVLSTSESRASVSCLYRVVWAWRSRCRSCILDA
jgi:hypothetical protein